MSFYLKYQGRYWHFSVPMANRVSTSLLYPYGDPTRSIIMVIRVTFFQTELMVEICSESLVRAIGKVLLMKFS